MDFVEGQLDRENPWPGLMPFSEAAQDFFHGREADAAELARRVRRELLTVLFGKSGLGKTSLLNAGLFPLLRADDFLPVYLRLDFQNGDRSPVEQIAAALADNLTAYQIDGRAPQPRETLWGFFHDKDTEFWSRRNRTVTPVLVFDQFEEIFTLGQGGISAQALAAELAALIENRPPESVREALERDPEGAGRYDFAKEACKVVIALREDFLPELEGLQRQIPSIMNNRMRLARMNGLQAREVILRSGAHLVGDGVAERIVTFVAASRERAPQAAEDLVDAALAQLEIEPALLSIVCRELNNQRRRAGQPKITADLLDGAQEEIVVDFYVSSLAGLAPAVQAFIEDELLTAGGYRDSRPLADALLVPGVTRTAIDTLVARRLLRIEERFGTQWIELTHDLLTEIIRQQRDQRREAKEAEAQRQRAERAEAEAAAQAQLTREAAEREQAANRLVRLTRNALVAVVAILVVALGTAYYAWREQRVAEQQRAAAFSAEKEAREEESDLRVEARRSHQQLVGSEFTIKNLADLLADETPPGVSAWADWMRGEAFSMLGDETDYLAQLEATLKTYPDLIDALEDRAYVNILLGRPKDALRDLHNILDFGPLSLAYTNSAVSEAMLGNYATAIIDVQKAIDTYRPLSGGLYDTKLAPEIKMATRHAIITADGSTYLSALRYTVATLRAIAGDPEFETALQAADAADPNYPNASDVYLLTLEWTWLIVRGQSSESENRPADYGALAATGAMWERMGMTQSRYYDWARQYYRKFEAAYREQPLPKYAGLARFVGERLKRQEIDEAAPMSTDPPDPAELQIEADVAGLHEDSNNLFSYAEGERLLTSAIGIIEQPGQTLTAQRQEQLMELYFRRAQLRSNAKDVKGARDDIERLLAMNSHVSEAYRLRGDLDLADTARQADYQRAIDEDPFNALALKNLADTYRTSDPGKALDLLQRRLRLIFPSATDYEDVAELQLQLPQEKPKALSLVMMAIAHEPTSIALYDLRAKIERASGVAEGKVEGHRLDGYRAVAEEEARVGADSTAVSLNVLVVQMAIKLQAGNPKDADMAFELEAAIRELSRLLEDHYGTAYAAQFWRDFAADVDAPQPKARIIAEAERINPTP